MNQHQSTRPPELHIHPPEVIAAENGWVLRGYDPRTDQFWYRIAHDGDELRVALRTWADETYEALQRIAEHRIKLATEKVTEHAS